jgi:CBS-domain-containing membrane protein
MLFYQPTSPAACPRNAVLGHLIGILAGYASLRLFGLEHATPALTGGMTWGWVGSASLSLALTAGVMIWSHVPHPPAGATTLIVSLGILPRPSQLVALFLAILLLVLQGLLINRLAGIPYPVWAPRGEASRDKGNLSPAPSAPTKSDHASRSTRNPR